MAASQDSLALRRQFCSGQERRRRRRRHKKRCEDSINEYTRMEFGDSLRTAEDRERWKSINATSSAVPRRDELSYSNKWPETGHTINDRKYLMMAPA